LKLKKDITIKINFVLDNILPPIFRDWKKLMKLLISFAFGKDSVDSYMSFKERLPYLNKEEIKDFYVKTANVIERETDLTNPAVECIVGFLNEYKEKTNIKVLDISCGRGFLTKKIADMGFDITGADIYLPDNLPTASNIKYIEGDVCDLSLFENNSFDCVICSHTLEHILDIQKAISELRRVCKNKLIIVVPSEREYRYTFNLHCHFFPYLESFMRIMQNPNAKCFKVGDLSRGGGGV
jgi:SAM-dependent methyltransferase